MFRMFRRRRGGVSVLLLVVAVCGIVSSCGGLVFGVPASIMRAREVRGLIQPSAAEAVRLAAGTEAIFTARIPAEATTDEVSGLALYYVEERPTGTRTAGEEEDSSSSSTSWERVQPPAESVDMVLTDGEAVRVIVPTDVSFMNSETIEETAAGENIERRTVGYRAGQTMAIEGTWEGDGIITAETFYRGSPEEFVTAVRRAPGSIFVFSILCGTLSFVLLIAGGVLRFLGR